VEQYHPDKTWKRLVVRAPIGSHLFCPFTLIETKIANLGKIYVPNQKRVIIKVSTYAGFLKRKNFQA
jgi:hypothetical protein